MRSAAARGLRIALPVVVEKGQPLVFREWIPGARLTRGVWNIPIPADGAEVTPDVIISPGRGFRSAELPVGLWRRVLRQDAGGDDEPRAGYWRGPPIGALPTIHPQPHDIPMDIIVTGGSTRSESGLAPESVPRHHAQRELRVLREQMGL